MDNIDDVKPKVRILKRWKPKEWRPEYTAIVALSCTGLSNAAVGKHFGYGQQQISNILNQPEALEIRKLIGNQLLETAVLSIPERLQKLQNVALSRVENLLNDDERARANPLQIFDRSFKFLQASGQLKDGYESSRGGGNTNTVNIQTNNLVVPPELLQRLADGLDKAKRVAEMHKVEPISIEPKSRAG